MERLDERDWRARAASHEARVDSWIAPVRERAARGESHPVEDFLFTYYPFRPGRLRRWSPGAGVVLQGWPATEPWRQEPGGAVLAEPPGKVLERARWAGALLGRMAARPARFGCSGLHEWAMVYRQDPAEVRHAQLPLRLGAAGTAAVVDSQPVSCSHFDAFRFFTPSARPLNAAQLTRSSQLEAEQRGCLHATMDLYRWAAELWPWTASELVADCFDLARRVRVLDMRASPYDLSSLGLDAVRVETAQGRAEYAAMQRAFSAEAEPLRARLLRAAQALVGDGVEPAEARQPAGR